MRFLKPLGELLDISKGLCLSKALRLLSWEFLIESLLLSKAFGLPILWNWQPPLKEIGGCVWKRDIEKSVFKFILIGELGGLRERERAPPGPLLSYLRISYFSPFWIFFSHFCVSRDSTLFQNLGKDSKDRHMGAFQAPSCFLKSAQGPKIIKIAFSAPCAKGG